MFKASGLILVSPSGVSSFSSMKGQPKILAGSGNILLNHSEGVIGGRGLALSLNAQGSVSYFLSCKVLIVGCSWNAADVVEPVEVEPGIPANL